MLARKLVSGCGHFLDDGVTCNEMAFRESEIAGAFAWVKVDDGDAGSWFEGRFEVAEVF